MTVDGPADAAPASMLPRRRWFGRGYVQPAPSEGDGEFLDYREQHKPHDCRIPGPNDGRDDYRGTLADGSRWRCKRCGSVWELVEYYFPYRKWYRREDPTEAEFQRTHDADGRPLTQAAGNDGPSDA